jgi:predicted transcriptional regulator
MRILVDLPEATVDRLTAIGRRQRKPRTAVIREALDRYAKAETERQAVEAFGLWSSGEDGLAVQRRLRGEW